MIAEILAAIGVVTILVVLLLLAVMNERLTRSIGVLRHLRTRYTLPVAEFTSQWERIIAWSDERENTAPSSPDRQILDNHGYTAANDL
ncbi:MAG: hypothetical protein WD360_00700 [Nitriliruptoraceae bacterium]